MLDPRTIVKRSRHVGFRVAPAAICDACGQARGDRRRFIAGPNVMICEECVVAIPARDRSRHADGHARAECSFCRRERPIVGAWPRVRICASCTGLVEQILAEDRATR